TLPLSEIDIPIKVYFPPLLARAESMVPKEFTSEKWPDYTQSSCDFRYKYRFIRSPLQISIVNNQANISFGGNYQIAGSRSVCAFGKTIAPWISGSCGFGNEPLRKVQIAMNASIGFFSDYKVRTKTTLTQLNAIDKCTVTLLNNDMTSEVMDSIKASVAAFTHVFDSSVGALDFSNVLKMVSQKSSRKIAMSKYGYLQVRPMSVRISPISLNRDTLYMTAGLSGYGVISSDSTDLPNINIFPGLQTSSVREGINIHANSHYDYAFLSKIITDTVKDKVFDMEGRTFVIKKIDIAASDQKKLEIRIEFTGNKKGTFILFGTPVLDIAKQTISIPDIDYDIRTKDVLLSVGEKLFRNKIINSLRQKAVVDIPALIEKNRAQINSQFNRAITSKFSTRGALLDLRITGLVVGREALDLQTNLKASLQLIASGF
ncbi:MAG TPA: DUF4403 family protein, partial [Chitinophagaceae bacterium]|nr:DUF4403 family protein [Chitinophagaceae bacterium]